MLPGTGQRTYSHFMLDGWKVVFMVEAPIKVRVSGRVPAFHEIAERFARQS